MCFAVERQGASLRHPCAGCIEPRPSLLKGDRGGRSGGRFYEGGEGAGGAGSTRGSHFHRPPTASSAGHLKRHDLKRRERSPRSRSGVCFAGCDTRAKGVAGRAGRGGQGCSPPVPIPPSRRCCTPGASPRHAAAVGAAGVKAAAARAPPLFASLTAPVVLCRAQRQPSRTERRRDGGTRKEERGTEERGPRDE